MGFLTAQTTIRMVRQGVMPYPRGEYSASVTDYYWNDDKRDIVTYNGLWWAVKKYAPGTPVPKGQYPSSSSAYWTVTSRFEIIVTAMMIADAIRTNALNVNDRFKVGTDGKVNMEDAEVTGIIHSLGPNTQLTVSDGYVRILYKGQERLRIVADETSGIPEVYMSKNTGSSNEVSAIYRIDGFSYRLSNGKTLNLNAANIGAGVIDVNSEGALYVRNNIYNYVMVAINASPSDGGSVSPFSGTTSRIEGSSDVVTATPAGGYEFDRWSDGGAQSHSVVWTSGKSLTAYFKRVSVPVVNYTVSLSASPTAGGSVGGGGTKAQGSVGTVTATPASGYIFTTWSDGGAQSHSVTWDKTKSLVAYFDPRPTTSEELLSNGADCWVTEVRGNGQVSIYCVLNALVKATITGYAAGDEYRLHFNKGKLAGKLRAGHTYRLTFSCKIDKGYCALVVTLGNWDGKGFHEIADEVIWGEDLTTTSTAFTLDLVPKQDATLTDEIYIVPLVGEDCVVTFTSISLKEVIE